MVADLVDEDQVLHQRENPISSMIFGANALLTKPGHSQAFPPVVLLKLTTIVELLSPLPLKKKRCRSVDSSYYWLECAAFV